MPGVAAAKRWRWAIPGLAEWHRARVRRGCPTAIARLPPRRCIADLLAAYGCLSRRWRALCMHSVVSMPSAHWSCRSSCFTPPAEPSHSSLQAPHSLSCGPRTYIVPCPHRVFPPFSCWFEYITHSLCGKITILPLLVVCLSRLSSTRPCSACIVTLICRSSFMRDVIVVADERWHPARAVASLPSATTMTQHRAFHLHYFRPLTRIHTCLLSVVPCHVRPAELAIIYPLLTLCASPTGT